MPKFIMRWLILLILVSCAHTVPNIEVCATGSEYQGLCAESLSGSKRVIPSHVWQDQVYNRLSISIEDFGKIKSFIKKVCTQVSCSKEVERQVENVAKALEE